MLDLGTSWRWVVSFTPWPLYPRGNIPGTNWTVGWVGPRIDRDVGGGEKSCPYRDSNSHPLGRPARGPSLFWLHCPVRILPLVESYITTDSQSASVSWNKAPIWGLRPDFYYCQTVAGLLMWGALSDERTGLSFTIAAGPHQRSHSRVRIPWDSRPYFTLRFKNFLFVASYDSQGYSGGIPPHLHTRLLPLD
jgi:hypothetical protein